MGHTKLSCLHPGGAFLAEMSPVPKQVSGQGRQVGGQCDIVLTPGSAGLLVPGALPGEAVQAHMETCSAAALRSDPLGPVLVAGEPRQAQVKLMEAISFS